MYHTMRYITLKAKEIKFLGQNNYCLWLCWLNRYYKGLNHNTLGLKNEI